MDLNRFKDTLFDLINESDELNVSNILWNEKQNLLVVTFCDGTEYALSVKDATALTKGERSGLIALS